MSLATSPVTVLSPIDPSWLDYNGHVNYAAYALAADPAIDAVYAAAGMDYAYRKAHGCSDYVLESHFFYLREIRNGSGIMVAARLVDFDAKRTHIFCEIRERDAVALAATAHVISIHVDAGLARSAEFPAFASDAFRVMKAEHQGLTPSNYFDDSIKLGRRIGSQAGAMPA